MPANKPEELIALGQKIFAKHQQLGANSPLAAARMTTMHANVASADTKNASALDFDAKAQATRLNRDTILGIAKGQSASVPNTVLKDVTYVRDQLLIAYDGSEEQLTGFGFNVVIGEAKSPTRKPQPPA